jgi:ribosomal protein L22
MTTHKKERERVREAMSKSLAVSPKRQQEIAEMLKNRLGTEDGKPEEKVEKRPTRTKV